MRVDVGPRLRIFSSLVMAMDPTRKSHSYIASGRATAVGKRRCRRLLDQLEGSWSQKGRRKFEHRGLHVAGGYLFQTGAAKNGNGSLAQLLACCQHAHSGCETEVYDTYADCSPLCALSSTPVVARRMRRSFRNVTCAEVANFRPHVKREAFDVAPLSLDRTSDGTLFMQVHFALDADHVGNFDIGIAKAFGSAARAFKAFAGKLTASVRFVPAS
eukprot:Skav235973  [mRNA]  locus=scaffold592:202276:208961:- [translate_table: standard]